MAISIENLENTPEYQVGLWYSPYVKVYSIGGKNRIAEISNYPRAYKDTTPHVYTEDTTVIEDGKEIIHYKGDSLPGAFPLWLASEDLPFTPNLSKHEFLLSDVPGPIKNLVEAQQKGGVAFEKLSDIAAIKEKLATGKIVLSRKAGDSDKQIIRIKYQRVF